MLMVYTLGFHGIEVIVIKSLMVSGLVFHLNPWEHKLQET